MDRADNGGITNDRFVSPQEIAFALSRRDAPFVSLVRDDLRLDLVVRDGALTCEGNMPLDDAARMFVEAVLHHATVALGLRAYPTEHVAPTTVA